MIRLITVLGVLAIVILSMNWYDGQRGEADELVIHGVTVLTAAADSEKLLRLEDQSVVIKDERIVSVKPSRWVDTHRKGMLINGKGKYLMPGLVDMHVHITAPYEAILYPANGVTTVRNMWGFPLHPALMEDINADKILGPRIVSAGRLYDGEDAYWPQSFIPETMEEINNAIIEDKAAGFDYIKVYSWLSRRTFFEIMEAATAQDIKVVGHVPESVDLREAANVGMYSMEHLWGFPSVLQPEEEFKAFDTFDRAQWDVIDDAKLESVAVEMAESGIWICPTLFVLPQIWRSGEENMMSTTEGVKYMSPTTLGWWRTGGASRSPLTPESLQQINRIDAQRLRITKVLFDKGARLLIGSDSNNAYVVHGFSLHEEMKRFIEAGIDPASVIKIATYDAALSLEMADKIGSVEAGKLADLLLVNADPTEDIANLKQREGVFVNGKWYPQVAMDKDLERLASAFTHVEKLLAAEPVTYSTEEESGDEEEAMIEVPGS